MNRGAPRKGFGGPQPNSGRKSMGVRRRCVTATDAQWAMFLTLGGSPWLQGQLNLKIKARLAAAEKSEAENAS